MLVPLLYFVPFILLASAFVLYHLWVIDMRVRLLPNIYVGAFAVLGIAFHLATALAFADAIAMAQGALMGGGILYAIRLIANWHYKADALGLGDVKLMAAAGVWLGVEDVLMALSVGALAGVVHGLLIALSKRIKDKEPINLARLELPAGPGFILGIIAASLVKFADLPHLFF